MISFKLLPETHTSVSKWLKVLTTIGFLAVLATTAITGISNYLYASKIMSNHKEVDASLEFTGTTVAHRKRHDVTTYHFRYFFSVDGNEYEKEFTTSESNADTYLDKKSIQVVYNADTPSLHGRLSKITSDADLAAWSKRFLISIPMFGVLAFIVYLILTRKLFVVRPEPSQS